MSRAVYLVLAELVERAGLVDSISGGQQQQAAAGGEGVAANIPVASGPDATREKVCGCGCVCV